MWSKFDTIMSYTAVVLFGVCMVVAFPRSEVCQMLQKRQPVIQAERLAQAAPIAPRIVTFAPASTEVPVPPNAPEYTEGWGVLQLAIGPTHKGLQDCKSTLWYILDYYKGSAWTPHITTVKWFGDKWTLVLDGVQPKSAEQMCAWLERLGWGSGDYRCHRMCIYRSDWFASKP
jgi:hypothetical protein